jgi:hypothetical protein
MEIRKIEDTIALFGKQFPSFAELKKYCMDKYTASSSNQADQIYAIYDYSKLKFIGAVNEKSFFNLKTEEIFKTFIPSGYYVICNIQNYAVVDDFLIQTTYRIDHDAFLYIEEYDLKSGSIQVYVLLRNNGIAITSIPALTDEQSFKLRQEYIYNFVKMNSLEYNRYTKSSDGYLWESLIQYNIISLDEVKSSLDKLDTVLFFWDSHPSLPLLYSIGKKTIFTIDHKKLIQYYCDKNIPEDIYIFDKSLTWTIVLTHESQNKSGRKHLLIGKVR